MTGPWEERAGLRTLVVLCPDWPVVASGVPSQSMAVVVEANRVIACSPSARAEGVRRGLRRREAQARCPGLEVIKVDQGRDARAFEPVVAAIESFTPGIEVVRPGVVALGTRGPSRYFGGDLAFAVKVATAVDAEISRMAPGALRCRVGVADGCFPAEQAARGHGERILVVGPGRSAAFVAPLPVSALPFPDLAGLLGRLGVRTLGDLAALPASSVLARFGLEGEEAHRLARGVDQRSLAARTPPPDLAVSAELDPPADRVDTAAFVAKSLADRLHEGLATLGLACTRVAIEAETEHGERLGRLWRHDGALSAGAIAERVRWQLDGWLTRGGISGGITLLRLVPDEVRPDVGRQLGFWGAQSGDEGIGRTLARLQGMLGPEGVVTAVLGGGRDPIEAVRLVPWGDVREPARPGIPPLTARPHDDGPGPGPSGRAASRGKRSGGAGVRRTGRGRETPVEVPPWPGRLPGPAPAMIHRPPLGAEVRDGRGDAVTVSGRGTVSAAPAEVSLDGGPWWNVEGWAGPWPVEERWWDGGRRRARFQVVAAGGAAHLLTREAGAWWVEATYD